MSDEIFKRVKDVIADKLDGYYAPKEITPESKLKDDLGADSLDMVSIVMGLEDEFGIEITDSDANGWVSVADVVTLIEKKVA